MQSLCDFKIPFAFTLSKPNRLFIMLMKGLHQFEDGNNLCELEQKQEQYISDL